MEKKLNGIVLRSVSYKDNDAILNIFTLEEGIVSAKIKGVKKAGAKLKFATQPFCFAEFVFSEKSGKRTVIGASLIDSFYSVREDVEKFFAGGVMLEYTRKFLYEGIKNEEHFILLIESLKDLVYGDGNLSETLLKFLFSALKLSGYGITNTDCQHCKGRIEGRVFFDYVSGAFCCYDCPHENYREISLTTLQGIEKLFSGQTLQGEERIKVLRFVDFYLQNKAEVKLKSLEEYLGVAAL